MGRVRLLAASAALGISVFPARAAAQGVNKIDVLINLVANSGVTREKAEDAVNRASAILRESAGIEFNPVFGDGNFTHSRFSPQGDLDQPALRTHESETRDLLATADRELAARTHNRKGIKLFFVRQVVGFRAAGALFNTANGWMLPGWPGVIAGSRGETAPLTEIDAAAMGETIAHEVGHGLGLYSNYDAAPGVRANDAGHVGANGEPGETGVENLMAPGEDADSRPIRRGTHLTPQQIAILKNGLRLRGKQVSQVTPFSGGQKDEQQYAFAADAAADQIGTTQSHLDLLSVLMESTRADPVIRVQLKLGGTLPSGQMDASYHLLFDSDGNASTGVIDELTGLRGIDREVQVRLQRTASGFPLITSGLVVDAVTRLSGPLPTAPVAAALSDLTEKGSVERFAFATELTIEIPKTMLAFGSAVDIPAAAVSLSPAGLHDGLRVTLELTRWQKDAALNLTRGAVAPGDFVAVDITGLTPNRPFTFSINSERLASGTTDRDGRASGSFTFPSTPGVDFVYALRARDDTGEAAFNLLNSSVPTLQMDLNRHVANVGDVQRLDVTVANLGAARQADMYLGILPPATSPLAAECPNRDPVQLFVDGGVRSVSTCLSNVASLKPLFANITVPGGLARTAIPGLITFNWPASTPAGLHTVFTLLTPPGRAQLLGIGADAVYFGATIRTAPRPASAREITLQLIERIREAGGR